MAAGFYRRGVGRDLVRLGLFSLGLASFPQTEAPPRSRWAVIILGEQGRVEERTGRAESKQTSHLTSHSLFSA